MTLASATSGSGCSSEICTFNNHYSMKKTLVFIAIILLASTLPVMSQSTLKKPFGQQNPVMANRQQAAMPAMPSLLPQKKEALATRQRLDSMFNELNMGTWEPASRPVYTYDAQQRITMITDYSYDDVISAWVPDEKEAYTYNVAGLLENKENYIWDLSLGQWVGNSKDVWVYDLSGKVLIETNLWWEPTINNWVPSAKGEYSYNPNNTVSNILWSYYDTDSSAWFINSKEERTYNANNQLTMALFSWWDDQSSVFQPGSKDEYTWHTNGKVSEKLSSMYDMFLMVWTPEFKEVYTYDAQGNNTLLFYHHYDWGSQQMLPLEKHEKVFNALKNLTEDKTSYYNLSTTSWDLNSKLEYFFNDTYALNDLILPFGHDDFEITEVFNHMVTHYNQYNYNSLTLAWEDIYRGTLYYSPQVVSSIPENSRLQGAVYPNPARNLLNIDVTTVVRLEITDLKGSLVHSEMLDGPGKHTIAITLKPGIYVYTLSSGSQIPSTGKLVIQ